MKGPWQVASASDGTLFVVSGGDHTIRRYREDGELLALWGGSGAAEGQLASPLSLAIDRFGCIYVADRGNHRIQKFAQDGRLLAVLEGDDVTGSVLHFPLAIAVATDGTIVVSQQDPDLLKVIAPDGRLLRSFGVSGSGRGEIQNVTGLAIGPHNLLYLADTRNNRIQRFTMSGEFVDIVEGLRPVFWPEGVAFDEAGLLYIASALSGEIVIASSEGTVFERIGGIDAGLWEIPAGVAPLSGGKIAVSDFSSNKIVILNKDRKVIHEIR